MRIPVIGEGIRMSPKSYVLLWVRIGLVLATVQPAAAQIIKCKSTSGETIYTQGQCPPGTQLAGEQPRTAPASGPDASTPMPWSGRVEALKRLPGSEVNRITGLCSNKRNYMAAECIGQREQWASSGTAVPPSAARHQEFQRACDGGDSAACVSAACDAYVRNGREEAHLVHLGTDNEVRACSKALGLRSSEHWAMIRFHDLATLGAKTYMTTYNHAFICLPKMDIADSHGAVSQFRPILYVDDSEGAKYRVEQLPGQVFSSIEAAATAGCEKLVVQAQTTKLAG
ncbi:MAG: hypothetical protein ABI769_12385 [Pseudomonadota bacterium]